MRSIRTVTQVPALLLFLVAAACGGQQKSQTTPPQGGGTAQGEGQAAPEGGAAPGGTAQAALPAIPAQPAPMPNSLLATISIGDPQGQLAQVAAYADAVNPGFGAMINPAQVTRMLAGAVGAPSLDGVDLSKPLYLLLLDPKQGGGESLLVVAVANEQQLESSVGGGAMVVVHDGFAAVGKSASLGAAAPYALSSLAKSTPPAYPHAVVYMSRIMDSYGPQLEAQMRQSMGPSKSPAEKMTAEALINGLRSVERIEGSLQASATTATASAEFYPVKGSTLAAWGGMQKPADYQVASRLPAGPWLMVAAGNIDWTPMASFLGELAKAQGKPELGEWFAAVGHEAAVGLYVKEDKALRAAGVVAVTDKTKAAGLLDAYIKQMAAKPVPMDTMQVTAKANAYRTGGAKLAMITVKPGATTTAEEKQKFEKEFGKGGLKSYFGLSDSYMVFALDKDKSARALAATVVKNAKAKSPKSALSKPVQAQLAASKARKESGLLAFDLSAIAPDPNAAKGATVTVGIGFDANAIKTRLTLPPETLKFFVMMRSGGGMNP